LATSWRYRSSTGRVASHPFDLPVQRVGKLPLDVVDQEYPKQQGDAGGRAERDTGTDEEFSGESLGLSCSDPDQCDAEHRGDHEEAEKQPALPGPD
jgi:hypothetical protein